MSEHMFLCIQKVNQSGRGGANLLCFPDAAAADLYIRDWLERDCGMDCYRGPEEEARLRSANGGVLPELAFSCPEVHTPKDLEAYNGFHACAFGSAFSLFVMAVYDEETAGRLMRDALREFELDKIFSDEADEMIEMLEVLKASFREPVDYQKALARVDTLLQNNGLPLF